MCIAGLFLFCAQFDNPADPANNGGFYGGIDSALVGTWDEVGRVGYIMEPSFVNDSVLLKGKSAVVFTGDSVYASRPVFPEELEGGKINAHEGQIFYYFPNSKNPAYFCDYHVSSDGDTLYWVPDQTDKYVDPRTSTTIATVFLRPWVRDTSSGSDTGNTGTTFKDTVDARLYGSWDRYTESGEKTPNSMSFGISEFVFYGNRFSSETAGDSVCRMIIQAGEIVYEKGTYIKDPFSGDSTLHFVADGLGYYSIVTDSLTGLDTLYFHHEIPDPNAATTDVHILLSRNAPVEHSLLGDWDKWDGTDIISDHAFFHMDIFRLGTAVHGKTGKLYARNGQIWCESEGFRSYIYDYTLDRNVLYLVEQDDELYTSVDYNTSEVIVLGKGEPQIELGFCGVWDSYNEDGTIETDSLFVVTPSKFIREGDTLNNENQNLIVKDGQIYTVSYGLTTVYKYIYDYRFSENGDSLWVESDIRKTYHEPDPADPFFLLIRRE